MQRISHSFRQLAAAAAVAALAAAGVPAAQAEDITLVSIQSMTGPAAFAGAVFQKSIQLAVDEVNAKGGIHGNKVRVIERDNAGDKGQAINLASQAIDRDRALMVLGPSLSADSLAVAPVFNEKRTPFLTFASSDAILKSGPWALKLRQGSDVDGPILARYLLEKTPIRKAALIFDRTNESLIEYKNFFRDAFKAGGGTVATEEAIVSNDSNFLPLATKLKSLDVDAVYVSSYAEQAANITSQLRKAGLPEKVRIVGSLAVASPKFIANAGKDAEGAIVISDYAIGIDRPLNKSFDAAYQARYQAEPDGFAAIGYSLAQVALASIKEAGPNPTREKVRDAYLRLKNVPVVVGSGVWNQKDRRPHIGALVLVVKDGKFSITQ
ncbi:ABC transporter substrate-binding protein [Alicycliphilus denitrificans]|uniref:Amino acid ABC transporter substrate-binding protein n=1 Tax=Alicycliphilus denitrificans TaxID=179636 RepID=A0A3R7ECH5_9BURK|nr:ABC transporter substrate-binding protein [Alicycliphilus denitrificans]RKJ95071.1 amino acid ABC transporter substrate-binding protein [Alicycliphilus denitrificans]